MYMRIGDIYRNPVDNLGYKAVPETKQPPQPDLTSKRKNFILAVERAINEFNHNNVLEVSGISVNYIRAFGAPLKPVISLDVEFKDRGGF